MLEQLADLEIIQLMKLKAVRVMNACEDSARVVGPYVDVLIRAFRRGQPSWQDIDKLRELNRVQGEVEMDIIRLRVVMEGIFSTVDAWWERKIEERARKVLEMDQAMDCVLQIARKARELLEACEELKRLIQGW